jgi:membrane fusion protein (multidrug efflux system)
MKQKHLLLFTTLAAASVVVLTGCKPAGEAGDEETVTEVSVQVGKVTMADLRARVEAYGVVEPEPAQGGHPGGGAKLAAPSAGVVMSVPVKEGEHVEAGTVIVKLDDRFALSTLALAEQQFERQKKLVAIDGTSEKAFQEASQQLAAARAQLALVQLATPLSGVVARINVQPGQAVDQNTVVAEIIDPERLVVTANVPAVEATRLKAGQPAEFFTDGEGTPVATGSVSFLSPQVDAKSGTAFVRVALSKDASLRPGQFVRLRITTEERPGRLAVPRESVYTDHDGQSTLSLVEGDRAIQKTVKVGLRDGDLVEVEGEGVTEGATVVTHGSYALPKETKVRILNTGKAESK